MTLHRADLKPVERFSSGSTLLDLALGGGWAEGRVINIVGDRSTGKTLLAIEGCANYALKFGYDIKYIEGEAAFDQSYAESVGLPTSKITFPEDIYTIEGIAAEVSSIDRKTLVVIDSLDSFSDEAELKSDFGAASYGAAKAKLLSQFFRRYNAVSSKYVTLMVISQVRDNIGVTFGAKHTRSGGKALDFYASQVVWLAKKKMVEKTIKKVTRKVGVWSRAKVEKNKTGPPFREIDQLIRFGYGVDNIASILEWFVGNDTMTKAEATAVKKKLNTLGDDEYFDLLNTYIEKCQKVWTEIESCFEPERCKYNPPNSRETL